ncbi:MAG: thioesterase family protein [Treponema sp.]|jgi:predicted thioesterase|nr:thioesterase family protein [Treponema sp.]
MDFNAIFTPGLKGEKQEAVTEQNTATAWGSGNLPVYATPAMIALLEGACVAAVTELIPDGYSTVGTRVDISHTAPTPRGMTVRAVGELLEVDGRRLSFRVEVSDGAGRIGEGRHERFIVEKEKFIKKAEGKKAL